MQYNHILGYSVKKLSILHLTSNESLSVSFGKEINKTEVTDRGIFGYANCK